MVFVLAVRFLHHALKTLTTEEKITLEGEVYFIPGLSLNTITETTRKIMQNLMNNELKDKNNVVIWHDVINNSSSRRKNNGFRCVLVPELLTVLKTLKNRLRVLVYRHRDQTPNFVEEFKNQSFTVLHVEKFFVSSEKKKDQDFMKQFREIHQNPELDLKHPHL